MIVSQVGPIDVILNAGVLAPVLVAVALLLYFEFNCTQLRQAKAGEEFISLGNLDLWASRLRVEWDSGSRRKHQVIPVKDLFDIDRFEHNAASARGYLDLARTKAQLGFFRWGWAPEKLMPFWGLAFLLIVGMCSVQNLRAATRQQSVPTNHGSKGANDVQGVSSPTADDTFADTGLARRAGSSGSSDFTNRGIAVLSVVVGLYVGSTIRRKRIDVTVQCESLYKLCTRWADASAEAPR